jgi:phosphoribosyl 1,2-cyclic phosphodiesterase
VTSHTDFATLSANIERIAPKRLVLTHMSDDMLAHRGDVPYETASDGLVLQI